MRVTVSHKKTKAEVTKVVNDSVEQLYGGLPGAPIQITNTHKEWHGDNMSFSFTGKMGIFSSVIKGSVLVGDHDVTVDVDLPPLLGSFIPEEKVKAQMETKIKGLLA